MTLHSTINNSAYHDSEEDDAESDLKIDQLVATHSSEGKKRKVTDTGTTNRNPLQKILIKRTIPVIILQIDPPIADGFVAIRGTFHARQTIASKYIVKDTACIGARVF